MKGQRAWVVGGAAGIGLGVARRLAVSGAHVTLVDRDTDAIAMALDTLPCGVQAMELDVTETGRVVEMVAATNPNDMPDILVNSTGGDTRKIPFVELRESDLNHAVAENLLGCFTMTRLCAPAMVERGAGRIVNLASVAGRTYSIFSNAAYVAAKAAVVGYTKQCAYELAATGVVVNAVAHGPIATERLVVAREAMSKRGLRDVMDQLPTGRYGTVDEAVGAVVHLCGQDAGYTTGSVIDVNGGLYV